MKITALGFFLALLLLPIATIGQVSLTCGTGSIYTQDFSFLGTGIFALTNNTPLGIYAERQTLNTSPLTFFADAGTLVTPAGYRNYGTAASADRTFGAIAGPAGDTHFYGIRIQNDCGVTAGAIQIQYTAEQWRSGSTTPQTVAFSYLVSATDITSLSTGAYINFPTLNIVSPNLTNAGAIDGNLPGNQVPLTGTITVSIPPGSEIMLRWTDPDDSGNDQGIGIDNLTVSLLSPTAAPVSVTGRVTAPNGTGIGGAILTLSGGSLEQPMIARTNPFGYFIFDGVPAGATYLLEISAKRYSFSQPSQVIQAQDNVADVSFVADGK
jgi:hypothetical protein